ncbi:MAG: hypothetical protein GY811_07580 [Myxococcales bacterium]|nr:hypothetical protein [Myxococcales bacterium]
MWYSPSRLRRYRLPCLFLLSACGADSDFSNSVSQSIFESSNGQLHAMHLAGLELEEWPTTFDWDCPGGGSIDMLTTYRSDESISGILHTLVDCVVDGRTLNGNIDYLEFNFRDCGGSTGPAFDIDGDIDITGADEGHCKMNAHESCSAVSGTTCGHEI